MIIFSLVRAIEALVELQHYKLSKNDRISLGLKCV